MLGTTVKAALILTKATLMAIYHILAAIFGWDKKVIRKQHQIREYQQSQRHSFILDDGFKKQTYSKDKGNRFEEYIVKKLNRNYFQLKEWRSDKGINGIYAESNKHPDLEIIYTHNSVNSLFAIECKYRSSLIGDAVNIAKPYQLDNYRKYSNERAIPVFIVLGLSGFPEKPDEEFIIPLESITSHIIHYDDLCRFKRSSQGNLYYVHQSRKLR